jgi:hypothetical protein
MNGQHHAPLNKTKFQIESFGRERMEKSLNQLRQLVTILQKAFRNIFNLYCSMLELKSKTIL